MPIQLTRNLLITSDDLNALRATAWDEAQTEDWDTVLAHSLGWVCATDGDRLVGFVNVAWDGGEHAFLLDTTVHRDYQRRGIGKALINEAASLARERGAEWLHVDYEDELEPFYRSCGFRRTAAGLRHLASSDEYPSSGPLGGN